MRAARGSTRTFTARKATSGTPATGTSAPAAMSQAIHSTPSGSASPLRCCHSGEANPLLKPFSSYPLRSRRSAARSICPWRGAKRASAVDPEGDVKLIGVLLIVFGLVALAIGGIRYTKREKVLDIGPVQATTEKHEMIPLSPIVGIAAVAGGIALVVAGSRTRV